MLTEQEVLKLAALNKLAITDDEVKSLQKDITSIIGYVDKLQELKINKDSLLFADLDLAGPRHDVVVGLVKSETEKLVKMAPDTQDNLIVTKAIFNERS